MKTEVTSEQIHAFLNGHNPMERIIKIEGDYNSTTMAVIYRDENGRRKVSHENFYPFCWAKQSACQNLFNGDRAQIKAKLREYGIACKGLRIENTNGIAPERMEKGFRVMFQAQKPMTYQKFMQFFKEGGRPIYANQNDSNYGLKEYIVVNPVEQFMIQTGKRQFKGYDDYDELLRLQFDLETEGLDPLTDKISQIGIRTNKGYGKIITVLGEGEEKERNELVAISEFFNIIKEIGPDVISGHNTENFDWNFINVRLQVRGSSLEQFTKDLFPHSGLYKSTKQKVLKLGGEMEYYYPTMMWGVHMTDSLFAVRRAQALNSNIKKADLKYITKFAKLNKENRVYVPGKIINTTWEDTTMSYAHNDANGNWFKITEETLSKQFQDGMIMVMRYTKLNDDTLQDNKTGELYKIVTGRYIVERYLMDDLYETDKVELSFNQTNYQVTKLLPVSFDKMCTMGTAAVWKYIMCTWSYENGLAIPDLIEGRSFTGGLSRLLVTGYVDNILKLDYNSLYPSIILSHYINTAIDIMGGMSAMLEYILTKREEYKSEKKNADKEVRRLQELIDKASDSEKIELLRQQDKAKSKLTLYDNMQSAVKVLGNGFFGSYGSGSIFPWSDLICAEETTCTGRMALRLMIWWFSNLSITFNLNDEEYNYRPLVGDTDGFNFQMAKKFRYTKENPYIGKGLNRLVKQGKEYINEEADLMEFNDLFMRHKMGLDIDEFIPANITCARKNYLDLLDNGKIKMVGNTLKSKKMPLYIEKFIGHAAELLLHNKGKEFLEYYYDYIEKIYNMQIPLKEIASVGKIKTSIANYKQSCTQLTAGGTKKARQAWYELAIKEGLDVHMGDAVYYINTGKKKGDSDVKRITKLFYVNDKGERIDYATDENGEKMYDRKGNVIDLTKQLDKEYTKYKKEAKAEDYDNPNSMGAKLKLSLLDFARQKYPNIEEEDVILFNCVMVNNELIEDEEEHFCDDTFEYNREKYIDMFNKRIRPLLVVFDRKIRSTINEKGIEIENILITDPKDRKTFTEEEAKLVSGQPFNDTDQDTYEQLMTMEDKEIKFWLSVDKTPTYIDYIKVMDWEEIKSDYVQRQETMKQDGIKEEIEIYNKVINSLKPNDITELVEDGIIPEKLLPIIDENFHTGVFKSKKWGIQLGTIFDIIDKDFSKIESEEE